VSRTGRPAKSRAGTPRKRPCKGCGASLEGAHALRVWCLACLAHRTNRACAARSLARTRSMGARAGRRIVDHAGELRCGECRKPFHATWHTRYPLLCPTCRGGRIVALNRRRAREWHARNRGARSGRRRAAGGR